MGTRKNNHMPSDYGLNCFPFGEDNGIVPVTSNYDKVEIDCLGNKKWYKNILGSYKLHREDGPAIESVDGSKYWYINGKLSRENGPAIEGFNGYKGWWVNGQRHRLNGPAIEYINGSKEWYVNGKLHREDGPAREYIDGDKEWYFDGKLHREDGPAAELNNGEYKQWSINDKIHAIITKDGSEWYIDGNLTPEDDLVIIFDETLEFN